MLYDIGEVPREDRDYRRGTCRVAYLSHLNLFLQVLKFRPILLSFCQEHFEKKVSQAAVVREQRPTIDQAELEVLVKMRILGNISFIASLYKAHFLPEKIIHLYVIRTLSPRRPSPRTLLMGWT